MYEEGHKDRPDALQVGTGMEKWRFHHCLKAKGQNAQAPPMQNATALKCNATQANKHGVTSRPHLWFICSKPLIVLDATDDANCNIKKIYI
jgi:hypothetical protein